MRSTCLSVRITPGCLILLRVGFTWLQLFPAAPVVSYTAISPMPQKWDGLLSVALAVSVLPEPSVLEAPYPAEFGLSFPACRDDHPVDLN